MLPIQGIKAVLEDSSIILIGTFNCTELNHWLNIRMFPTGFVNTSSLICKQIIMCCLQNRMIKQVRGRTKKKEGKSLRERFVLTYGKKRSRQKQASEEKGRTQRSGDWRSGLRAETGSITCWRNEPYIGHRKSRFEVKFLGHQPIRIRSTRAELADETANNEQWKAVNDVVSL